MSYFDQAQSNDKGKKKPSPNAQSLLPQEMREANTRIQGQLTKFQQNLRQLEQGKKEIGTDNDSYDFRQNILAQIRSSNQLAKTIGTEIEQYGDISVAFQQQKI